MVDAYYMLNKRVNQIFFHHMKRVAICVPNPWEVIPQYDRDYSIMVLNPAAPPKRNQYLLDNSDWSLLVTADSVQERSGADYPNERAFWYTSGTTGDSKFYGFSHDQINHVAQRMIDDYAIDVNDRYVSIMGLHHAHGQMLYWVSRLVDMETHFLPVSRITTMHTYHPTFITAIPDILKTLSKQSFNSLRFVRSASTALYNPLYENLVGAFGVPVIEAFGMTESCSHCFTNPLYGEQRMGTIGKTSGIEARIDGERLMIRGPAVCTDGWVDTGDLATVDADGYYSILGRARDRINVRGFKLDPISLEQQASNALPLLDDIAVFGTNQVRCAYVGPYTVKQVTDFFKSLGSYCYPARVEQLERIPVNASGKISRTMLNELFA